MNVAQGKWWESVSHLRIEGGLNWPLSFITSAAVEMTQIYVICVCMILLWNKNPAIAVICHTKYN